MIFLKSQIWYTDTIMIPNWYHDCICPRLEYQIWLFTKITKSSLFHCYFWHFWAIFGKPHLVALPKHDNFNLLAVHVWEYTTLLASKAKINFFSNMLTIEQLEKKIIKENINFSLWHNRIYIFFCTIFPFLENRDAWWCIVPTIHTRSRPVFPHYIWHHIVL